MKKNIAVVALTLALSVLASSQTAKGPQTVCKGDPIPAGFTIIGESESPDCRDKAWVIKQRGTPKLTMQDPIVSRSVPAEGDSGEKEQSSSPDSDVSPILFAKTAFELLLLGDMAVEEMIDWEHLKLGGTDFGAMLRQMAAAAGKDLASVRKEMISSFGMQYKAAGEGPLTGWRIRAQNSNGTTVAAKTSRGLTILFTVAERNGKHIITALNESR